MRRISNTFLSCMYKVCEYLVAKLNNSANNVNDKEHEVTAMCLCKLCQKLR